MLLTDPFDPRPGAEPGTYNNAIPMPLSQCSTCGQPIPTCTNIPQSSVEEEVSSILRATQSLDDAISTLNARRARLLQRLNELRPSTRVFPPEILSTIFHHVSPPIDFAASEFLEEDEDGAPESHAQVTLSAVSWHWRRVALTTPQLWTSAVVNVTRKNAQRKAFLIQLYLKNIGNMPMSLALHIFPGHWRFITEVELDPIFIAIWQAAQKFKLLGLCSLPKSWIPLLSANFSHLEDLRLKWAWNDMELGQSGPQITPISALPRLRQLCLWSTPMHIPLDAPCNNVTMLRFLDVPLHISTQMLILCPNLVEYRCYQSPIDFEATVVQLREAMTFTHMKVFHSPCSASIAFSSILPKLQFPALEALGLELNTDAGGLDALLSFILRLPATWPTLEISGYGYARETLERIFESIPSQVWSLHLPDIDCWNLGRILKALGGVDRRGNPHMVGLRHININSSSHSLQSMEDLDPSPSNPQLFLAMISARKDQLPDGHFHLEIESDNEMDWEEVRDQLRQMVLDGLKPKITMAGKPIHCLEDVGKTLDNGRTP